MKKTYFSFSKYSIVSLFIVLILTGCFEKDEQKQAQGQKQMPPPMVATYTVNPSDVSVELEYPARIVSVNQVQITARVAGTLESKHFEEGSNVKKGDLLYKIDDSRYKAAYEAAKANVDVAQANLTEVSRNYKRIKNLYDKQSVSLSENDTALARYRSAEASLLAAKADLKAAKVDYDYTKVYAPIDGIIGLSKQDIGSYVGTSTDNILLTTVTQMDPIYAEFSLPDIELLKKRYIVGEQGWNHISKANLPVTIITSEGSEYPVEGKLDFLDTVVDTTTATIKARATFPNNEGVLIPGLFVNVKLGGLVQKDAITIPQIALQQDGTGTFVYKVVDSKLVKATVKTSTAIEDKFIISEGLNSGDVIVTNNLTKVRPGMPVQVAPAK